MQPTRVHGTEEGEWERGRERIGEEEEVRRDPSRGVSNGHFTVALLIDFRELACDCVPKTFWKASMQSSPPGVTTKGSPLRSRSPLTSA